MNFQGMLGYIKKNYLIVLSCLIVLFCFAVNYVRSEQITRLEADYDDLDVRRSRILKNFKNSTSIEEDLAASKEMLAEAESRLFQIEDLAANQRYFYQVESSSGATISNLQQIVKPAATGKNAKKAKKTAAASSYQEIIYDMNVVGEYEEVIAFLRQVEGGNAFATLSSLSVVNKGAAGGSVVTARISLEVLAKKS